MRRFKSASLLIYTLGCILAVGCYVSAIIYDRNLESTDSIDKLPITLLVVMAIIIGVPNAIAFGSKLLQCLTGFGIFGIGCALVDVAVISYFAFGIIKDFPYEIFTVTTFNEAYFEYLSVTVISVLWMILPIVLSAIAMRSNIKSLRN